MNPNQPNKVVTRFAPSPTGFMHIGGVRTALFAYLYARHHQGTFILRIEDTDKSREVDGSIPHIQECLSWLGIEWDYGPDKPGPYGSCIQSERLPLYHEYAQKLIDKGLAYADPYTEEELTAFRKQADAEKRPFLYRLHRPTTTTPWSLGMPLRLKTPEIKRYSWHDAVRGDLSAGEEMLDDFILIKADGYPTYNFAHIIDDLEMGVTHIMRGDEFISSTPKFLSLYDALEIPYPVFVTLPPILRDDRTKKLGKRDGAKDMLEYRDEGYLADALRNYLAFIGWNPGTDQEIFTKDELIAAFSLDHIQKGGGAFNEDKLKWMNREHLKRLPEADFSAYMTAALPASLASASPHATERFKRLVPSLKERFQTQTEAKEAFAAGEFDYVFTTPNVDTALLQWKNDTTPKAALPRLQQAILLLKTADFSSPDTVKAALWDYATEVGKGELLWPLRVALSGKAQSPDPFTIAWIIGQEETLLRIENACGKLSE